jgi:catechol 2,3-dioxygenase-like lactoylglutathione lyase family enzyme
MLKPRRSRFLLSAALTLAAGAALSQPAMTGKPAPVDPYVHRSNFLVADLDRELTLYRDILGLKVDVLMPVKSDSFMYDVFNVDHKGSMRIAFLSSPDKRFGAIGFTEVKGVELPRHKGPYPSVLIIEIQGRFESVHEKAKAANPKLEVSKVYELTNPSRREFLITDYDGNRIIVMQLHAAD